MGLFNQKPSEDKVLEIFNALSSEQKEAVKSKLIGADKPATEVVPEKKADDIVEPTIEEPKAEETSSDEVEETSTEDKEEKTEGAEQEPQKSYEELLKEIMEQVNKKLDSIDQKYSERLENLDKKPDKKGFGMAESSKEYKATYTPEDTSDDIIKKLFN